MHTRSSQLIIHSSEGLQVIDTDEIVRMEATGSYTKLILWDQKPLVVSKGLGKIGKSLPHRAFFRIHRSHIVNLQYLEKISSEISPVAIMRDKSEIEISRRKLSDFMKAIKEHFKEI